MTKKDGDASGENIKEPMQHLEIVTAWDGMMETLKKHPGLELLIKTIGFDLPTLVDILNRLFSNEARTSEEHDSKDQKTEDITLEELNVGGRTLDRLLVKAYPPAMNPNPTEMTQFQSGGEIILITEGEAELTYADKIVDGSILKSDLKTVTVKKGDLIISSDTPNNWTSIHGDNFSFMYFVGNPNGPQKYSEIPKIKVPVK